MKRALPNLLAAAGAGAVLLSFATGAWATRPVAEQLCGGRQPCTVAAETAAGHDAEGRPLRLFELALGPRAPGQDDGWECRPNFREIWLVIGADNTVRTRKLMDICNDGYGAAGIGEDEFEIGPNRLVHRRSGGSAWRWSTVRTVQLSPLAVVGEESCSYHNIGPGFERTRWSWRDFRGTGEIAYRPDPVPEDAPMGCDGQAAHVYRLIPHLVEVPAGLDPGAVEVGSCGVRIAEDDGADVIFGRPTGQRAEMRSVLVGDRDLLVTVRTSAIRSAGASWVHDDHIEIWQGDGPAIDAGSMDRANLRQWGIRLSDGRVFGAFGKPAALPELVGRTVRTEGGRTIVSLRLRMPEPVTAGSGLTLIYSGSEGGRQAVMIGTSPLRFGEPSSIGGIRTVPPTAATCAVRDGRLEVVATGQPAILED